jgi:hypothetical protein
MFRPSKRVPNLAAILLLVLVGYLSHLVLRDPSATTPESARSFLPLRAEIPLRGQFWILQTVMRP